MQFTLLAFVRFHAKHCIAAEQLLSLETLLCRPDSINIRLSIGPNAKYKLYKP